MSKVVVFVVMWCVYLVSIALMVADLILAELRSDLAYFYTITNAILVFRILGVFWFLMPLHSIAMVVVIVVFIVFNVHNLNNFYKLSLIVPIIVQSVLSFDLMLFRSSRTPKQQAYHAGIHAHMGLSVVIIYFWSVCGVKRRHYVGGLLTMMYMLVFLGLCLTPHFHGLSKAVLYLGKSDLDDKQKGQKPRPVPERPKNTVIRMGTIAPGHIDDHKVIVERKT